MRCWIGSTSSDRAPGLLKRREEVGDRVGLDDRVDGVQAAARQRQDRRRVESGEERDHVVSESSGAFSIR